jgi:hypothetical protein
MRLTHRPWGAPDRVWTHCAYSDLSREAAQSRLPPSELLRYNTSSVGPFSVA